MTSRIEDTWIKGARSRNGYRPSRNNLYRPTATRRALHSAHYDRVFAMIDMIRGDHSLPLVRAVRLLLHNLQDLLAGVGAVLGVAVDGDGLLQRAHVVLAVHVDPGARHLGDLPYSGALPADYRAHHVRLDEDAQREVGLPAGTGQPGVGDAAAALAAASSSALRGHLHFQ